ncbi:histidine kinase [Aureisphaera galaxeae]|uniref:tetratricopeptide repeat-containing sensor histidine kinase n=1 Tax=Aureisphaera galaxeae TaxID=1538023 RepID=UPI002350E226|nr:histidine kinase [Aureisphaera galaxeae]MDC8003038.1 histidine kinase [Aureisphaera galaxeae]
MRRFSPFFLCAILCMFGCHQKKKESYTIDEIHSLHKRIDSISEDSVYPLLKNLERAHLSLPSYPDSLRAENNYLLGRYFQKRRELDSAALYFYNAIDMVKDSMTREREGYYFMEAFDTQYDLGLYGNCFPISEKFKSILNPDDQYYWLSLAHYWEERVYLLKKDYDNALAASKERVAIARTKDTLNLPEALIGQADILYYNFGRKEEAFSILESLIEKEDDWVPVSKRRIYTNYGVYKYFDGDYQAAFQLYLKALENAKLVSGKEKVSGIGNCYNNIAEVLLDLKQYDGARKYLDSTRLLGLKNLRKNIQKSLLNYELRLALENTRSSSVVREIQQEISDHQDELYRLQIESELLDLTKANEREKVLLKEKQASEIRTLKLQNRSILLLISIGLLSIIGFLFYQSRKLKFEKQSLQNQQRLLRSQMNPHFTFNTLYAIQNQIKKAPDEATQYLLKFSRLLRLFLENSMGDYIALEKEIDSLKKYMDLQLMRTPVPFEYEIHYINMEEDELLFIPPMLLQPFVENSIEHGFSGIDYTGKIDITLTLEGKFIACSIEDNGKGLIDSEKEQKDSASIRLISNFLKKSTKKDLKITDKNTINPQEHGLLIRFLIPFKLTEHD